MAITSLVYFIFLLVTVVCYYILPKKWQWMELLFFSVIFYCLSTHPKTIGYLIISTLMAWVTTNMLEKSRENNKDRARSIWQILLFGTIIVDVVLWFLLKGKAFVHIVDWMAALGMGYYTLQIIGYSMDCYWGNIKPQKNFLKLFLFTSFFPQLIAGPISRYSALEHIYEKHVFQYENLAHGTQRILWGMFKKLVIAERVRPIVDMIWASPDVYGGCYTWIALLIYPLQMYADFSGCMDIVIGTAELFGIRLAENFNNPFLALTSQEFWQRWHITLGGWAKDYVLYPLLKSKFFIELNKRFKKKGHKKIGKFVSTTLGMFVLWGVMGIWHGDYKYIVGVSLWYWTILTIENLLEPIMTNFFTKLGCDTNSFGYKFFQRTKTYMIYAIGAAFFRADGVLEGIGFVKRLVCTFTNVAWNPWILFDGSILQLAGTGQSLNVIIFGAVLMILVAILREKNGYARNWLDKQPLVFRWMIYIGLLVLTILYGKYGRGFQAAEFIYGGF